jgi:hypothetical protein
MAACTATVVRCQDRTVTDRPDVKIQMHNLSAEDLDMRASFSTSFRFGSATFALRPESRGSVHIRSPDPNEPPAITANYLADPRDRKTSVAALRLARRIAEQPALKALIVREVRPGPDARSDVALLEHIARLGATSYHPIGTRKMGTDAAAVVDPELRVHGIRDSWSPTPYHADHGVLQHQPALLLIGERCRIRCATPATTRPVGRCGPRRPRHSGLTPTPRPLITLAGTAS